MTTHRGAQAWALVRANLQSERSGEPGLAEQWRQEFGPFKLVVDTDDEGGPARLSIEGKPDGESTLEGYNDALHRLRGHLRMTLEGSRARVELLETAPRQVVASWLPHNSNDPGWTGSIVPLTERATFPIDAWNARDRDRMREWYEGEFPGSLDG
jgi:hypothetical protein